MKAAIYDMNGAPDVLHVAEIPDPVCAVDGIVIRVRAISVEGGDIVRRATEHPAHSKFVLGYAAAGEVVELGRGAQGFTLGQRVTTMGMDGAYAELRAVPASASYPIPDLLNFIDAAAVPIAFSTAHRCLFDAGHLVAGETVLVQAGAGGLGIAAIELAVQAGATVMASVSGAERAERLKALGVAVTIDRHTEDIVEVTRRATNSRGVDLVIDPVGGDSLQVSLATLKPHGRLVFVGNAAQQSLMVDLWPALLANITLSGVFIGSEFGHPATHIALQSILEDVAQGRLKVITDRLFPLHEAADAHRYIETNQVLGRVLLVPGSC